jgi:thiamine-monophosphate kinase
MVVTTDFSLEGRHFRRDWHSPESVGHRCLARGLSDVAAMGAKPMAAFLSLGLPGGYQLKWVDGFMAGFRALAEAHGVELAGGDTAQTMGAEIVADVVVTGAVKRGKALLRSGARVGDRLYVTGKLGGAAVELARLASGVVKCPRGLAAGHPHAFPQPRVEVGLALVRRGIASACMDLSDGRSTDLGHLCRASGVGAEVDGVPLAAGASLDQGLHGGEDYELLFAARAGVKVPRKIAGVEVTCIGRVVKGEGVRLGGKEIQGGGWEHFREPKGLRA